MGALKKRPFSNGSGLFPNLDNDGDLILVINNLEDTARI